MFTEFLLVYKICELQSQITISPIEKVLFFKTKRFIVSDRGEC